MRRIRTIYDWWLGNIAGIGGGAYRGAGRWLLRDEFTDTRAAGSVNGTSTVPGPGTRTVVDTENKISVGSGVLSIAGGKAAPAYGDPALFLSGVSRSAGRILVYQFTKLTTLAVRSITGWFQSQNATDSANAIFDVDGSYSIIHESAGQSAAVPIAFTVGGVYYVAIVLRSSGAFYYIKGGAYTTWTLFWLSTTNNAATVYPTLSNRNMISTHDFIRVPSTLWLPTPLAYDTFTRSNGALGNTETTGPDGQAVTARAWTATLGTWAIASNVANCTALDGGASVGIATLPASSANVIASVAVTRAAGQAGLVLRYQDADNYLFAFHDGTNAKLTKRVAGVETNVISAAAAYGAARVVRVILDGTAAELYYNGVRIGTGGTVPASSCAVHGLYTNNTNPTLDNFTIFPRGSGGEYDVLNNYIA